MGLLLGPQFVRFEVQPGCLRLEGVNIGEMGVDGLFAIIPKRQLKLKLTEIERICQG